MGRRDKQAGKRVSQETHKARSTGFKRIICHSRLPFENCVRLWLQGRRYIAAIRIRLLVTRRPSNYAAYLSSLYTSLASVLRMACYLAVACTHCKRTGSGYVSAVFRPAFRKRGLVRWLMELKRENSYLPMSADARANIADCDDTHNAKNYLLACCTWYCSFYQCSVCCENVPGIGCRDASPHV